MNTIQEIIEIKEQTESLNRNARLAKATVDSLIDEYKELQAVKYGVLRDQGMTQADAKERSKYNEDVIKLRKQLAEARKKLANEWSVLLGHEDYVRLLISYNSTKRAELQQGI
jgi:hypothetical protein